MLSQSAAKISAIEPFSPIRMPRKVATPLPPLKRSQTGKRWPRKAPSPAASPASRAPEQGRSQQHRRRALQHVAEQGQCRQLLVAGAQDIRRADIAGADAAQVGPAAQAGQDDAEGDRAEQIAEDERSIAETGQDKVQFITSLMPPLSPMIGSLAEPTGAA